MMPRPQCGTVVHLRRHAGVILGSDGKHHHFKRDDMVRWLEFLELRPGDVVTYELEAAGDAFNVELVSSEPRKP